MGGLAKCAASVAVLSVLLVLMTPAPEEAPCTASTRTSAVAPLAANAMPLALQLLHPNHGPVAIVGRFFVVGDIVSFACASFADSLSVITNPAGPKPRLACFGHIGENESRVEVSSSRFAGSFGRPDVLSRIGTKRAARFERQVFDGPQQGHEPE